MVEQTLTEVSSIYTISVVPYALLLRHDRSMQSVWLFTGRYALICSYPCWQFLKPELLCQTNSLQMRDKLRHFDTPGLCELWDVLDGHDYVGLEINFDADIKRTHVSKI